MFPCLLPSNYCLVVAGPPILRYTPPMTTQTSKATVSFRELLDHAQDEFRRWHEWFHKHPQALDVKTDIATAPDVRTLVLHIVACEHFYAEWLSGEPITPWQSISTASADGLFAVADSAFEKWRNLPATASEAQWDEVMAFPKPMETSKATRRKCFFHTFLHSVRHWAQLATALRAAGFKQDWQHDFIFSPAME
ncbi:MAG: DinB family protein [Acidobacteriia bacterium]|nr:DinB family protein [Terriglobia bacterium]